MPRQLDPDENGQSFSDWVRDTDGMTPDERIELIEAIDYLSDEEWFAAPQSIVLLFNAVEYVHHDNYNF